MLRRQRVRPPLRAAVDDWPNFPNSRSMSSDSEPPALKRLNSNRPNALVALGLVGGTLGSNQRYFIRYPGTGGPQPLLGVGLKSRKFSFGGKGAFTPKAIESYLRTEAGAKAAGTAVALEWEEPDFSDALTVLPTAYVDPSGAIPVSDPILLAAFSVVAAHYESRIGELARNAAFMNTVPKTLGEPPYRQNYTKKMQAVPGQLLAKMSEEEFLSPEGQALQFATVHGIGWELWNVALNDAIIEAGNRPYWEVLTAWTRWDEFGMGWRERAAELAGKNSGLARGEYEDKVEALKKRCSRLGLKRAK